MPDGSARGHPVDDDLGRMLALLLRSHRARVTPALGDLPHGPRGYQALAEVVRADHPSQLALASRLGLDRTVMTYLVDDLVEAGLVERQPNPRDRRQRLVVATPAGRAAVAELCTRVAEAEAGLLSALDAGERDTFRRLLTKAACGLGGTDPSDDPCAPADED